MTTRLRLVACQQASRGQSSYKLCFVLANLTLRTTDQIVPQTHAVTGLSLLQSLRNSRLDSTIELVTLSNANSTQKQGLSCSAKQTKIRLNSKLKTPCKHTTQLAMQLSSNRRNVVRNKQKRLKKQTDKKQFAASLQSFF